MAARIVVARDKIVQRRPGQKTAKRDGFYRLAHGAADTGAVRQTIEFKIGIKVAVFIPTRAHVAPGWGCFARRYAARDELPSLK